MDQVQSEMVTIEGNAIVPKITIPVALAKNPQLKSYIVNLSREHIASAMEKSRLAEPRRVWRKKIPVNEERKQEPPPPNTGHSARTPKAPQKVSGVDPKVAATRKRNSHTLRRLKEGEKQNVPKFKHARSSKKDDRRRATLGGIRRSQSDKNLSSSTIKVDARTAALMKQLDQDLEDAYVRVVNLPKETETPPHHNSQICRFVTSNSCPRFTTNECGYEHLDTLDENALSEILDRKPVVRTAVHVIPQRDPVIDAELATPSEPSWDERVAAEIVAKCASDIQGISTNARHGPATEPSNFVDIRNVLSSVPGAMLPLVLPEPQREPLGSREAVLTEEVSEAKHSDDESEDMANIPTPPGSPSQPSVEPPSDPAPPSSNDNAGEKREPSPEMPDLGEGDQKTPSTGRAPDIEVVIRGRNRPDLRYYVDMPLTREMVDRMHVGPVYSRKLLEFHEHVLPKLTQADVKFNDDPDCVRNGIVLEHMGVSINMDRPPGKHLLDPVESGVALGPLSQPQEALQCRLARAQEHCEGKREDIVKMEKPGGSCIDNFENRVLNVFWREYNVPSVGFMGLLSASSAFAGRLPDNTGFYVQNGVITVDLPPTIVDDLCVFWSPGNHIMDAKFENLRLSVARCVQRMRTVACTSKQQDDVILYAPIVAYLICKERYKLYHSVYGTPVLERVSNSVEQTVDTWCKFHAYRPKTAKFLVVASVVCVIVSSYISVRLLLRLRTATIVAKEGTTTSIGSLVGHFNTTRNTLASHVASATSKLRDLKAAHARSQVTDLHVTKIARAISELNAMPATWAFPPLNFGDPGRVLTIAWGRPSYWQMARGWIRDLTREGIEPNPGWNLWRFTDFSQFIQRVTTFSWFTNRFSIHMSPFPLINRYFLRRQDLVEEYYSVHPSWLGGTQTDNYILTVVTSRRFRNYYREVLSKPKPANIELKLEVVGDDVRLELLLSEPPEPGPSPPTDLTTEGVEPNPGPSGRNNYVTSVAKNKLFLEALLDHGKNTYDLPSDQLPELRLYLERLSFMQRVKFSVLHGFNCSKFVTLIVPTDPSVFSWPMDMCAGTEKSPYNALRMAVTACCKKLGLTKRIAARTKQTMIDACMRASFDFLPFVKNPLLHSASKKYSNLHGAQDIEPSNYTLPTPPFAMGPQYTIKREDEIEAVEAVVGLPMSPTLPSVMQSLPAVDLTRYGIEPNPGWEPTVHHQVLTFPKPSKLDLKVGARISRKSTVKYGKQRPDDRVTNKCSIFGVDALEYGPIAMAGNADNEYASLVTRTLARTLEPTELLDECIAFNLKHKQKIFPRMNKVNSITPEAYIKGSGASPAVKAILTKTLEELRREGIDEDSVLTKDQLRAWTKRSAFVKVEWLLYCAKMGVKEKSARMIMAATPQFIMLVGPWIAALQNLFKRRWNKDFAICFTSGMDAKQMADYITEHPCGTILEDDIGKFDASVGRKWALFEIKLCKAWGAPRAVLDLMRANIDCRGETQNGWKFFCEGTRKSGDPYTSLFNSMINGCAHLFLYHKFTGKTIDEMLLCLRMLVAGDDNLAGLPEYARFDWASGMRDLGFDSEALYRSCFEEAEFCSNRLYPTLSGYCFGPKPGKVLAKFGCFLDPPKNLTKEGLMKGVALGLVKQVNFIPPLRAVVERVLSLTTHVEAQYTKIAENKIRHKMNCKGTYESGIAVAAMLDDLYHWSLEKQKSLEQALEEFQLGDAIKTPFMVLLYDRDTSGVQDYYRDPISALSCVYSPPAKDLTREGVEPNPGWFNTTKYDLKTVVKFIHLWFLFLAICCVTITNTYAHSPTCLAPEGSVYCSGKSHIGEIFNFRDTRNTTDDLLFWCSQRPPSNRNAMEAASVSKGLCVTKSPMSMMPKQYQTKNSSASNSAKQQTKNSNSQGQQKSTPAPRPVTAPAPPRSRGVTMVAKPKPSFTKRNKVAPENYGTNHMTAGRSDKKIKGRGEYEFGKAAGKALGSLTGIPGVSEVGGWLGGKAHELFKSLTGWGDYRERASKHGGKFTNHVKALTGHGSYHTRDPAETLDAENTVAMGHIAAPKHNGTIGGPMSFDGRLQGNFGNPEIIRREFIGNVYSSTTFNTTRFNINPGIADGLFPWGRNIASLFDRYCLTGCELFFESTCSSVAGTTNTAEGTVMMSTVYDVNDGPLITTNQILNNEHTTMSKPSSNFYHPIECNPAENPVNCNIVRTGADVPTNFTDIGIFQISTEGMQASGILIGKLWISYKIEYAKPKMAQIGSVHNQWHGRTNYVTGTSELILPVYTRTGSNLPMTTVFAANSSPGSVANYTQFNLVFPAGYPGRYFVHLTECGNGATTLTTPMTNAGVSGITPVSQFYGSVTGASAQSTIGAWQTSAYGSTQAQLTFTECYDVPTAGGYVALRTYVGATAFRSASVLDLHVIQVSGSLTEGYYHDERLYAAEKQASLINDLNGWVGDNDFQQFGAPVSISGSLDTIFKQKQDEQKDELPGKCTRSSSFSDQFIIEDTSLPLDEHLDRLKLEFNRITALKSANALAK